MAGARSQARQQGPPGRDPVVQTQRAWKGLNVTDSRLTLDPDELYQCENAMPLGRGIAPTPLYNGDAGASIHAGSLIKQSFGTSMTYGLNTVPHPVSIWVFEDGSAWMRDHYLDGATDTQIAPVGTFGASPLGTDITIWQDGPILFLDDQAGYCKWDGTAFTVIDATKKGHCLSVFSGYVFLLLGARTISVTAPNTFDNFTAGAGAVIFKITDEAFEGAVQRLLSTVSQLWIVGVSAIDALGNIATNSGITTFSVTNAVTTIGSAFGNSVTGYFRSLVFSTGYSLHSLLGVTPQKLSGKIDRLFQFLSPAITFGPRPGVVKLNGILVLTYIFNFLDPTTGTNKTVLVCFAEGKLFIARTPDLAGNRVLDMVTLTVSTTPEVYGIDAGGFIYRLFARSADAKAGTVIIGGNLSDGGAPTIGQQAFKVGFDFSAPSTTGATKVTMTLTTEAISEVRGPLVQQFFATADSWVGLRYSLFRTNNPMIGQRLGWTLSYPCADQVTLEAAHLSATKSTDMESVIGAPAPYMFINADGSEYVFTNADLSPYVFLDA